MPFIITALQLTPAIVAAGEDIVQFVDWALKVWNTPGGPQQADWEALHAKEAALRASLT
jgi:hypothetical protein